MINELQKAKNGKTFIEHEAGKYEIGEYVVLRTSKVTESGDFSEEELAAMSPRQRKQAAHAKVAAVKEHGFIVEGIGESYYQSWAEGDVCRYYGTPVEKTL